MATNFDADEIIEIIQSCSEGTATTWLIGFRLRQKHEKAKFTSSELRKYLQIMADVKLIRSKMINTSSTAWIIK